MGPNKPGPRGLTVETWNAIHDRLESGSTPEEIREDLKVSLTKIYEIKRAGVRKPEHAE